MTDTKIRYYRGKIDLEEFEAVESPAEKRRVMVIGISQSGHFTMNDRFRSVLKKFSVDFQVSKDRRMILIDDEKGGDYLFPKSGRKKDLDFVRLLSAAGLAVPCRYVMKYCEKQKLWVGEYTDTVFGGKGAVERELEKEMRKSRKERKPRG